MPVPSTTVSFVDIQTEFGGTNPISIDEYYNASGKFCFNIAGIPSSGQISMNNFRGKSKFISVISSVTGTNNTINTASDNSIYNYAYFANSGNFTIDNNIICDILIVAGGGGGGGAGGGGGGAGGLVYLTNRLISAGTYSIVVGSGGLGNYGTTTKIGGNSSFNSYIAYGGGGGEDMGGEGSKTALSHTNGGSGGGGERLSYYSTSIAGRDGGSGVSGQGNNGGEGKNASGYDAAGGGGGGAGAAGQSAFIAGRGGDGGIGRQISITGNAIYYAGGGGGGSAQNFNVAGTGGTGGGGNGAITINYNSYAGQNGVDNLGGGGGGGSAIPGNGSIGGNGGSGVVIIRYPKNKYKRYPPKTWNSITGESDATINGKSCRLTSFTLNSSGITYGSGTYNIYYIPLVLNYLYPATWFFDNIDDVNDAGGHLENTYNTSNGIYQGSYFLVDSSYKGSWFVIQMPVSIVLRNYFIIQRSGLLNRAPRIFRLYGSTNSTNWTLLDDVTDAVYTSQTFYKNINNNNSYNYYGVVVNSIFPNNDSVCNFIEFGMNEW